MAAKKPIYAVHCTTKFGFGLQYVKADNKKESIAKFKKRFTKQRVIDSERVIDPSFRQQNSAI